MATYSSTEQVKYISQWFGTWSEFQKEDFITILAQKLAPSQFINGLVNGLQNLNCSSRPPSLFSCQIKLFSEWWDSWNEEDRENFKTKLRANDSKFWKDVEGELNGTRKKLNEDFFLVASSGLTVPSSVDAAEIKTNGAVDVNIGEKQSNSVEIVTNVVESSVAIGNGDHVENGSAQEDPERTDIPEVGAGDS